MITYSTDPSILEAEQLTGFFVGWPKPPSPETHLTILRQSRHTVVAVDDEQGRVIGFVNAVGDGVMAAYIPLLEVLPDYQGRGIGQELMRRILREIGDVYMVDLVCDEEVAGFYEPLGFKSYNAMMIRRFDRQDCS